MVFFPHELYHRFVWPTMEGSTATHIHQLVMYITMIKVTVTVTPRKIHCSLPLDSRSSSQHSHSKLKSKNAKKRTGAKHLTKWWWSLCFLCLFAGVQLPCFLLTSPSPARSPVSGRKELMAWCHSAMLPNATLQDASERKALYYSIYSTQWFVTYFRQTLPPIIMEMENGLIVEETASSWVGIHSPRKAQGPQPGGFTFKVGC